MYIGNDLQIANPSYKIIDDISSGFNGSAVSFALQVNGESPVPFPISTQQVTISVNGVIQEPDPSGSAGFKLLGSNIVFSSAPANGHAFFGVINAGADYVTAGSEFPDGSATAPSFTFQSDQDTGWFRSGSGAVNFSANGVNKVLFDGNGLTVTGTCTATAFSGNGANITNVTANAAAAGTLSGATLASGVTASSLTSVGTLASLGITGNLTVDTNSLFVKASNGFIGIGTATPTDTAGSGHCVDITGGSSGTALYLRNSGGDTGQIDFSSSTMTIRTRQATPILFNTNNSERARIDTSGRLLIGTTSGSALYANGLLQVSATSGTAAISVTRWSDNGSSPYINLGKSRGAIGAYTIVQSGDRLGQINFTGADGTDLASPAAGIAAYVDGTPGSNDMPGRLVFFTASDGSVTETERLRLDSAGRCIVGGGTHAGGSALVVKGGSLNTYSTAGFFSSATNPAGDTDLGQLRFGANTSAIGATIRVKSDAQWGNNDYPTKIIFETTADGSNSRTAALTLDSSQNATFGGTVSDSKGNLRAIPLNLQSSTYTLVASDAGKHVRTNSNVTIPNNVFAAGDAVTIINQLNNDITLTQASGLSLFNAADASLGNRTLASRGMCTLLFTTASVAYISGAGLS